MSKTLFCDACGDQVKAIYPCKFVFHDGLEVEYYICPECMKYGELHIDLPRKRLVSIVANSWSSSAKKKWKDKANNSGGEIHGNV